MLISSFSMGYHSKRTFLISINLPIILIIFSNLITFGESGCAELRLCCKGRNLSCIALDTGRHRPNVIPEGTTSAEARRRGGTWHVHLDRGMKLDNFEDAFGGERFFETLFGPSTEFGDRQGGDGQNTKRKSENMRLTDIDYPDTRSIGSTNISNITNGDIDYGSGEVEFANVDWLPASKEKEMKSMTDHEEVKKIDNYKIMEDDRYQMVDEEHKEGDAVAIRYLIESDEIPITIEQLEMLQNYRSLVGGTDKACYCDEACKMLGDCCGDYSSVCPVVDCLVSEWSDWTPCQASGHHEKYVPINDHQNRCGFGISRRERRIVRAPLHGGTTCPILEEQRTCYSTDTPHCQETHSSEVAHLIPYEYGRARVPGYTNSSAGIFYDLPKDISKFNAGKTYCITYEITWINSACTDNEIQRNMNVGKRVCVECQPTAQTAKGNRCGGEGHKDYRSTWNMVDGAKHCHGFWKPLEERKEQCKCENEFPYDPRYLFV